MNANGTTATAVTKGWVANAKGKDDKVPVIPPRTPKDGREFFGTLVGGYRDTREKMVQTFVKDYGIRCVKHFMPARTDLHIHIDSLTEICILLDDLKEARQRVIKACDAQDVPYLVIERGKPHTWDLAFLRAGFPNPPKWRDGSLIINRAEPKKLEEARKAEVAAIEARPSAWKAPEVKTPVLPADIAKKIAQATAAAPTPEKTIKGLNGMTFGQQIRALRERRGWSPEEMAEEMGGITGSAITQWETGHSKGPMYTHYLRLREIFSDFPVMRNLRGEAAYKLREKKEASKPKPLPKFEPKTKEATSAPEVKAEEATTPVVEAKAAPVAAAPVVKETVTYLPIATPQSPFAQLFSPPPVVSSAFANPLDEYLSVIQQLQAVDEQARQLQLQREQLISRVDALHKIVTGR